MNNGDIRKRAWEIFKAAPVALLVAGSYSTVAGFISDKTDSLLVSIPLAIISVLITIGGYYMYIRGWVEGRAVLKHLLVPFQSPVYRGKIIPIILVERLIAGLTGAPVIAMIIASSNDPFMMFMNGGIMLLLLLLLVVVAVAISLVWYIFVMEPELKVFEIFKKSAVYMARHWAGLMWFRLTIMIIPVILSVILMQVIDEEIVTLLLIPVDVYVAMAGTGYVYENILMEEQRKEQMIQHPPVVEPVMEAAEQLPAPETIEQLTDRLSEEAAQDIALELPEVEAEETPSGTEENIIEE